MTVPTIDALPTPAPTRNMAAAVFVAAANALLAALPTLVTQINAFIVWLATIGSAYAASISGTSTTNLTIGLGSKSLTTQTGLGFPVGATIYVASGTNQMVGDVTSYNSATGALVFNSTVTQGSGSFSAWDIGPATVAGITAATAAELLAGSSTSKAVTPDAAAESKEPAVQTTGGSTTLSLASTCVHHVTANANLILNALTGLGRAGQPFVIRIIQDGTGNRTLTINSAFKFAGGSAPTLSTTAGAIDEISGYVVSTTGPVLSCVFRKGIA